MAKPSVCVVMSTYNGELYLKEQIDSILDQENVNVFVCIRDDNSTDSTSKILEWYSQHYDNVDYFVGKNVGVGNSFMTALYHAPDEYDYYAFADQDDIWDRDKLYAGVFQLYKTGKMLYASNQECIDKDGNSLGLRYGYDEKVHTESLAVLQDNMLAGCTFIFTKAFKQILCQQKNRPSDVLLKQRIHDVWVINVAAIKKSVIYDSNSHMKYRQHEYNAIGADSRGMNYNIRLKFRKIFDPELRNGRSRLGKELYNCFDECKNNEIYIACCSPQSFKGKTVLLRKCDVLRAYTGETRLGIILKIIFNLF